MPEAVPMFGKPDRVRRANELLRAIGGTGCHFFFHDGRFAYFHVDVWGAIWFHDSYTQRPIYTHSRGRWRGFTGGGTLRELVTALRDYIRTGNPIRPHLLGPWPEWLCGGDLWGYGEDMTQVRAAARRLGIIYIPEAAHA